MVQADFDNLIYCTRLS